MSVAPFVANVDRPLAVDLCCGLGGWTEGLLAEGWDVIGYDIEQHVYGDHRYPAQLVLQDIRTIDGRQFRGKVSLIVASPPCQEFSYMAMPWKRAKQIAQALYARKLSGDGPPFPDGYTGSRTVSELTALFDACVRIGREAECPIVIENVRGAQPWVGRSRWAYGSFHLFGDVPALMPMTLKRPKVSMASWRHPSDPRHVPGQGFNTLADQQTRAADGVKVGGAAGDDWFTHHNRPEFEDRAIKNSGGSWFNVAHNTTSETNNNPARGNGVKIGGGWFRDATEHSLRRHSSGSNARKAASARIAKIPLPLARHIAHCYYPTAILERAL